MLHIEISFTHIRAQLIQCAIFAALVSYWWRHQIGSTVIPSYPYPLRIRGRMFSEYLNTTKLLAPTPPYLVAEQGMHFVLFVGNSVLFSLPACYLGIILYCAPIRRDATSQVVYSNKVIFGHLVLTARNLKWVALYLPIVRPAEYIIYDWRDSVRSRSIVISDLITRITTAS